MERLAQREMHTSFEKVRRSDIPRLFRPHDFQTFFPKSALLPRALETLSGMKIDLQAMKNVTVDTRELTWKNPRPLTLALAVPGDVRISVKPTGGARDQADLLHELGHALHYGFAQAPSVLESPTSPKRQGPPLDFELNKLGGTALTEAYAALFEDLAHDSEWLQEHAKLTGDKLSWYLLASNAQRIFQIRRRAGMLLYDLQAHRADDADARALYRRIMSRAYGLTMTPEDDARYLVDRDEFFESADELRGWLVARQVRDHLKKRFGSAWWKSPEAGNSLRQLWSRGNAIHAEELPQLIGAAGLGSRGAAKELNAALQAVEEPPGKKVGDLKPAEQVQLNSR